MRPISAFAFAFAFAYAFAFAFAFAFTSAFAFARKATNWCKDTKTVAKGNL
jgi:hypothetical protein